MKKIKIAGWLSYEGLDKIRTLLGVESITIARTKDGITEISINDLPKNAEETLKSSSFKIVE